MAHHKVLVANRGEISSRIVTAAGEVGMSTMVIYSEQDRLAGYLQRADACFQIGESGDLGPLEAYLDGARIVNIAKQHHADLVHPGYGFLSENVEFAAQVREAGLTFVGPPTEIIRKMGDKVAARQIAQSLDIPTIPGTNGPLKDLLEAYEFAEEHGYPVVVKANFGGGGRGMRVIRRKEDIEEAIAASQSEARAAFGNGAVYMERYLCRPKHIERNHQKIIEFAPAANISPAVRRGVLDAAIRLAKGINYATVENAGTVEFLVEGEQLYFIEMNPRIQVEHTVTEEITGIDIVSAQLRIACGATLKELGLAQDKIHRTGFAVQCRVNTEIPSQGFRPDSGTIRGCRLPTGRGVRLDHSECFLGASISPYYDSLLVKCICSGADMASTVKRAIRALKEFQILGVQTNIAFLVRLLEDPTFAKGNCWTSFVETKFKDKRNHPGSGEI
ncbi:carbamoyl-phosphate synthase L chain, ATP binding domain-containing protein [Hirsutella rhossiliensis]|uniref:Carbamoyl-phosphate synthase L chain, ATP binding domain-containing protein n=1 Tax=Hirsutella rhossiliensis TaxID=111463 RepID=A0A9P8N7P4_9HYPO|nr:carbamoyl-phosphate synthase L chain, ATP binding domain-containing protein [Hirsutella rhossiliensis]KAH0968507.1 carbamoyl-phosphate synthase L chain, ATP binding domain-containing protein [Hirsutella rhossiliensis]